MILKCDMNLVENIGNSWVKLRFYESKEEEKIFALKKRKLRF